MTVPQPLEVTEPDARADVNDDPLLKQTGLNRDQRRERAKKASAHAHDIRIYVERVVRFAPALTPELVEQLRAVIGPIVAPDVYAAGLRTGAQLAREAVLRSIDDVIQHGGAA